MNNLKYYLDDSRTVVPYKIQKALDKGNTEGVRQLAKFVESTEKPNDIYLACERQRIWFYQNDEKYNPTVK